jgi:short-subunit dehydrogenase
MATSNHRIIAVCRSTSTALQQLPVTIIDNIDITDEHSRSTLQQAVSGQTIDLLIHNAGAYSKETIGFFNADEMANILNINSIAPLMISEQLLPQCKAGSKIIMITSRMGSIADNSTGERYSYRMSKAALNAATKSLSLDLKKRGIIVGLIHPGHVATEMGGPNGIPVNEAVTQLIHCIENYTLENSGQFLHANGSQLPW